MSRNKGIKRPYDETITEDPNNIFKHANKKQKKYVDHASSKTETDRNLLVSSNQNTEDGITIHKENKRKHSILKNVHDITVENSSEFESFCDDELTNMKKKQKKKKVYPESDMVESLIQHKTNENQIENEAELSCKKQRKKKHGHSEMVSDLSSIESSHNFDSDVHETIKMKHNKAKQLDTGILMTSSDMGENLIKTDVISLKKHKKKNRSISGNVVEITESNPNCTNNDHEILKKQHQGKEKTFFQETAVSDMKTIEKKESNKLEEEKRNEILMQLKEEHMKGLQNMKKKQNSDIMRQEKLYSQNFDGKRVATNLSKTENILAQKLKKIQSERTSNSPRQSFAIAFDNDASKGNLKSNNEIDSERKGTNKEKATENGTIIKKIKPNKKSDKTSRKDNNDRSEKSNVFNDSGNIDNEDIDKISIQENLDKAAVRKEKKEKQKQKQIKKDILKKENKDKAGTAKVSAVKYLQEWKDNKEQWKFSKVRQVWLLQNMFDSLQVDEKHFKILLEYLEGLKGQAREITVKNAEKMVDDETALQSGNMECPTSRKKLICKRSFRPNPNSDALISKIYPSRDEYEVHQGRVLAKLNKHRIATTFTSSIEDSLRQQTLNRAQRVRKHASDSDVLMPGDIGSCTSNDNIQCKKHKQFSDDSSSENSLLDCSEPSHPDPVSYHNDIELVFKPYPKEGAEKTEDVRYIKTTANVTVDHISKYLTFRLSLEVPNQSDHCAAYEERYDIYILSNGDNYILLPGNITLNQVHDKYWKVNKPLEMYFSILKRKCMTP